MKLVIIESPYAGNVRENEEYARAAVRDSVLRGEAPIASHLLFTQPGILWDEDQDERLMGMKAGWEWYRVAEACVAYVDHGISGGMSSGISMALEYNIHIEHRHLRYMAGIVEVGADVEVYIGGQMHRPPGVLYSDGCWFQGDPAEQEEACKSHGQIWKARYYSDGRRDELIHE